MRGPFWFRAMTRSRRSTLGRVDDLIASHIELHRDPGVRVAEHLRCEIDRPVRVDGGGHGARNRYGLTPWMSGSTSTFFSFARTLFEVSGVWVRPSQLSQ